MINHFRTLLANIPDEGDPDEFLSPNFLPVALPKQLEGFYKTLFAGRTSRASKLQLVVAIENLLKATRQDDIVTSYDKRKTYDLNSLTSNFQIFQISNPISNTSSFSLLFNGVMEDKNRLRNTFIVRQYSNQNNITIFSVEDAVYLKGKDTFQSASQALIPVTFSSNSTQPITIGSSSLSFTIVGSASFTATSDKEWVFAVDNPAQVDLLPLYDKLKANSRIANDVINYSPNDSTSLNYWNQHFNPLFKLAGLLNLYISKVNELWLSQK